MITSRTGKVFFVGAGPGDPDLITVRGLRALQAADVVLYDALIDPHQVYGLTSELIYVGKRCGRHHKTQEEINQLIVEQAEAGKQVVRLKGGDPGVLGRVGEEALELAARGIPFEIVPGVSSALAAPAYAGIPLTMRGVADSFALATAHRRKDQSEYSIPAYNERTTLLLLMPVRTASAWREELLARGYPPTLPIAFVSAATTNEQSVLETTVDCVARDLATVKLETPAMAVVGRVVALRKDLKWFPERQLNRLEQLDQAAPPLQKEAV